MRVSELVEQECRMAMLVDDIDISRLIVFSQQIKESKLKKEKKRSGMDKDRFDGHGFSNNRQKFSRQGYSNAPTCENENVSNTRLNKEQ